MLMNGFVPPACTLHSRPVAGSVRPGVARSVGTSLSVRVTDPGPRACRSAAASQAATVPARQMHRSQVPSTVMARAGRRGCRRRRDAEAPHSPASSADCQWNLLPPHCQRPGLDPPWPQCASVRQRLGYADAPTSSAIDRDATRGPEWMHWQVPTPGDVAVASMSMQP